MTRSRFSTRNGRISSLAVYIARGYRRNAGQRGREACSPIPDLTDDGLTMPLARVETASSEECSTMSERPPIIDADGHILESQSDIAKYLQPPWDRRTTPLF